MFFLPNNFPKYEITLINQEIISNSKRVFFNDIDGDGKSEKFVLMIGEFGNASYILYNGDGALVDRFNLTTKFSLYRNAWFQDANKNGTKEFYILTKSNDSIFLNIHEHLNENKVFQNKIFVDKIGEHKGTFNFSSIGVNNYFSNGNTTEERLLSHIKLDIEDSDRNLKIKILSENEQVVNTGAAKYSKTFEASVDKTFITKTWLPLDLNLVTTRFDHKTAGKESGFRTYGNLGVTKLLSSEFPQITTNANINTTFYSLDNSDNITRTSAGAGIDLSFPFERQTSLFGSEVIRQMIPRITYNYRAKKVQGNIPIFDTTDKYDDIITFSDLTSGERYTGLDRITNANDVTLSFESSYRKRNALDEDKDLLNFKLAQSFYADTEVVSDTASTDYEARRSYSDIAASIDLSVNEFFFNTTLQFDPKIKKLVKKQNELSYQLSPNNFLTFKLTNDGDKQTEKLYGSYTFNNSITLFAAIKKTNTSSTNISTTEEFGGAVFETCCFAYRITHSKDDENGNNKHDYSTSFEVVLKGLGSTSNSIQRRIEDRVPNFKANNN